MQPTPDEHEIPGVVGRRSARLSIIVPITVHGTDATGQAFKENTWTISVNKHGGRIATFHRLAVDDQVLIENPLLGRAARARVNRICEKRFAEDPFEVCVELLEAQNVWGVRLPPEDWEKERQSVLDGRKGLSPQAEPRPPATSVALPEDEIKIETTHLAPGGLPVEAGEQTGGLSQFNLAVHALTRLAGEAAAPPTQPAAPPQEPAPTRAPALPAESPGLAAFESLQKTIHEAQSLREELNAFLDRMQNARGEVENLLSRTTQVSEEFQSQIEGARRSNEDSFRQSLEALRREMQADTLDAGTQARKICKEESGTAVKAISVCVDSAVDLLNRAGDEAAARLQGARQTLELSLKKAEESLPHLASDSASLLEKFRGEAEAFAGQLRSQLESTARESSAKASAEISEKLEGSVESAMEVVVRDFNKQAEEALELLKEGLRSAREQCVEETQKQLGTARESALSSLESEATEKSASHREQLRAALVEMQAQQSKEMEAGIQASLEGLLEALRGKIQETQGRCVEETQRQLSAARESALSSLESEATEKSALYQEQLRAALAEMQAQQSKEMEAGIQASLEGLLETLRARVHETQEQYVEETEKQLGAVRESALSSLENEATEKSASYREQLRAALAEMQAQHSKEMEAGIQASLEGLLEALRGKIQETQGRCVEETQRQLSAARESALSSLESEATEKSALYQEQLRAALVEMQAQQTREMGTGIQASLQGLLESLHVKVQTIEEHCVEETAKQLAVLRESTLSLLESEAAEKSATYREQLRAALVETQSQQLKEMERGIQATVEGLLESLRERIESTAEETAARVAAEVRNGADQALQELPERLSKSVEMAVFVVKEWEQQTRTELEAHARRLLEAFEKRLDASSAAAQKRQRSEAEAFKSMLQNFLDHAEALSAESTQAKAAARVEFTEAPSRPAQPSAEPSTPALENLMEKQRKIIEDTLGAFRFKLSQTLASTTSKR
jgi:hypothetical protein